MLRGLAGKSRRAKLVLTREEVEQLERLRRSQAAAGIQTRDDYELEARGAQILTIAEAVSSQPSDFGFGQ